MVRTNRRAESGEFKEVFLVPDLPPDIRDAQAATVLLRGSTYSAGPGSARPVKPRTSYFKPGSDFELTARRALARILRSDEPVPKYLRLTLANLFFQPEDAGTVSDYAVDRKLVFEGPRGSKDRYGHFRVADSVFMFLHNEKLTLSGAIEKAADSCCLSVDQVERIWYDERKQSYRLRGLPLPPGKRSRKKTAD